MFVHDDGDAHATLFHGDVDWEPYRVTDAGGRSDAGDLILNDEECAFVIACWIATAWRREDAQAGRRLGGVVATIHRGDAGASVEE